MFNRTGPFEKWPNYIKKYCKSVAGMESFYGRNFEILTGYVQTGEFPRGDLPPRPEVVPSWLRWEHSRLATEMSVRSLMFVSLYETKCMTKKEVQSSDLYRVFLLSKYSFFIAVHMYAVFPKRFGFECNMRLDMGHTASAALGVVIGKMDEATPFFKLLIKAYNNNWFIYGKYEIFAFILRLMADYLNEDMLPSLGQKEHELVFQLLLNEWRTEDPNSIKELCLGVCDYHTHRCKPDRGREFYEFNNGWWSGWPIEITLLFKLRELLGLQNPELDHPLMNSPLGQLPTEVDFSLDELSAQVIAKMHEQGFNEEEVFDRVYSH